MRKPFIAEFIRKVTINIFIFQRHLSNKFDGTKKNRWGFAPFKKKIKKAASQLQKVIRASPLRYLQKKKGKKYKGLVPDHPKP
jgi:hypothetical protein